MAIQAMKARRELQERVEQLKGDFDEEQKGTFEITANMTRQYKAMQEQLLNEINKLENTINELKDKLGTLQSFHTSMHAAPLTFLSTSTSTLSTPHSLTHVLTTPQRMHARTWRTPPARRTKSWQPRTPRLQS